MINSRDISELHPIVQEKAHAFLAMCKDRGIEVIVTSTYRDHEAQDALYAQGRTKDGRVVTNAKGGQSFHNWRVAFDVVPVINGRAVWDDEVIWQKLGDIGIACGLEWGGKWKFRDYPHFQWTNGLKLADFQAGARLEDVA